jgi:TolB-like protein
VNHVRRLLSPETATPAVANARSAVLPASSTVAARARSTLPASRSFLPWIVGGLLIIATGYFVADRFWISKHLAASTAFNPPPHSIAVLPFANMSGDKGQEYFSDGLTEELLNSLSEINELQVAARTSAFSFKGKDTDIGTIARKLNVGAVLEGSVRRSANTIRITAQLINAVTGFHLWSKTYDRDLGDVLKLQTEIANAVASALKVTLLGDVAAKVELGGTGNPAAFDAYLRGAKAFSSRRDTKDLPAAVAAYTEAIRLDPHYALAFASRSIAHSVVAGEAESAAAAREGFDKAQADARQALALAPDLVQGHLALATVAENGTLDFTRANDEYERALALAPGNAQVLRESGGFAALMGHFDAGVAATRRAVVLDPLARASHSALGGALSAARRYEEAVATFAEVIGLDPDYKEAYGERGFAYYGLGDLERARGSCETKPDYWVSQQCLAVIYDKLGRHADAEAELAKLKAANGDAAAYQYATIYAQWGNRAKALESLDTALRLRDPGLELLKTDPLMDPLRKEPRFQAIERELKFPT